MAVFESSSLGGVPLGIPTMGEIFQDFGYNTHYIGKWHLGLGIPEHTPLQRGWESFYGFWSGGIGKKNCFFFLSFSFAKKSVARAKK